MSVMLPTFATKVSRHAHKFKQLVVDLLVRLPQHSNQIFSLFCVRIRKECVRSPMPIRTRGPADTMNVILAGRRVVDVDDKFYVRDI